VNEFVLVGGKELVAQARIPCDPNDKTAKGEHKHLCPSCGTCWKHDGTAMQLLPKPQFKEAHTCGNCGEEVRAKYRTDSDPDDDCLCLGALLKHILGETRVCLIEAL
jgi:hypothetical protein